ncbi:MAG: DUF3536 domain-containing protein [Deltaproteobacteria bacterium]|nr:DUF3536 domain-containing protein [Deltaproteobacteria bacterium]
MTSTQLILHGHFYQPPRENPWTGTIERQDSAAPFHDWNQRVHDECYRRNAWARIVDGFGKIERIVNNYERISMNFGPTVLAWMELHDPGTYQRILDADRRSAERLDGHGNAIAQAYNHSILPLCTARDRQTQVAWGLADFRHRFKREPEAMWLPETAVDLATVGCLIDAGMRYVILAPSQAARVRRIGSAEWRDVADGSVDPGIAYRVSHPDGSGRSLAAFFYDGPIARSLAFEGALASSQALLGRLRSAAGGPGRLIHAAVDGESFGHHHANAERTLAHALNVEAGKHGLSFTNYGDFLARHPPAWEAEVKDGEGTAWSCAHGLGRWQRDCGCSTGAREGWNQAWRGPLRQALDLLRDSGLRTYQQLAAEALTDPWQARDAYIELVLDPSRSREAWLQRFQRGPLSDGTRQRVLTLLEAQRQAQLMYTSCAWFFADISGIETVQVLRYAARALELYQELGLDAPREAFLDVLAGARSNLPEMGTGADCFRRGCEDTVTPTRVAAHVAIGSLVDADRRDKTISMYRCASSSAVHEQHGRLTLTVLRVELDHQFTSRRHDFAAAALHMGGVDFYCALRPFTTPAALQAAAARLRDAMRNSSLPVLLRMMQEGFGPDECGLEGVLPGGSAHISALVLGGVVRELVEQFARVYVGHERILEMLNRFGFDLPPELRSAAEFVLSHRFTAALADASQRGGPSAVAEAQAIVADAARRGFRMDPPVVAGPVGRTLLDAVRSALDEPALAEAALGVVALADRMGLKTPLTAAQELAWQSHELTGRWPAHHVALAQALGFVTD